MKRLGLVFSRGSINEMLDSLDRENKELQEFTHENKDLEKIRRRRRSPCPNDEFKLTRMHAAFMYKTFVEGRYWNCLCRPRHTVSLCLKMRRDTSADKEYHHPVTALQILLSEREGGPEGNRLKIDSLLWRWREVEVRSFKSSTSSEASVALSEPPTPVNESGLSK